MPFVKCFQHQKEAESSVLSDTEAVSSNKIPQWHLLGAIDVSFLKKKIKK